MNPHAPVRRLAPREAPLDGFHRFGALAALLDELDAEYTAEVLDRRECPWLAMLPPAALAEAATVGLWMRAMDWHAGVHAVKAHLCPRTGVWTVRGAAVTVAALRHTISRVSAQVDGRWRRVA